MKLRNTAIALGVGAATAAQSQKQSEQNNEKNLLGKSNKINSSDEITINSEKNNITKKIDKQETPKKDFESNNDIRILKNKKPKSNFI